MKEPEQTADDPADRQNDGNLQNQGVEIRHYRPPLPAEGWRNARNSTGLQDGHPLTEMVPVSDRGLALGSRVATSSSSRPRPHSASLAAKGMIEASQFVPSSTPEDKDLGPLTKSSVKFAPDCETDI